MGQSSIVSTATKLIFRIPITSSSQNEYIDLAQCLSVVNRRSYRQGMNYAIAGMEAFAVNAGRVSVSCVPTTWVADNATTKAFEYWKEQRAEVLEEQPSLKAKWSDFKIFMDATHSSAGVGANLIPSDGVNDYHIGDWNAAEVVVPVFGAAQTSTGRSEEMLMHIVGDHTPPGLFDPLTTSSVSLIKAYSASRGMPLAPDPAPLGQFVTGFYNINSSSDEKSENIQENITYKNDNPPYDRLDYPGGDTNAPVTQFVDTMIVRNWGDAGNYSSDSTGAFVAPLGLLRVNLSDWGQQDEVSLVIDLVPGKYKGILAERGL
ncbi:MAG: hypothetical protein [Circular genetic element sp.]|nr:MAG: hypothetical protein [Circular genetic element sp.]